MADLRGLWHPENTVIVNFDQVRFIDLEDDEDGDHPIAYIEFLDGQVRSVPYNDHNMTVLDDWHREHPRDVQDCRHCRKLNSHDF